MKHLLLTTIAAVLLVACASEPEYSGSYSLTVVEGTAIRFQLKSDGSFIGSPEGVNDDAVGTWKVEGDLLVCEGTTTKNSDQITVKFDKTTFKLISLAENGEEAPLDRMIPEGENGIYLRKSQQSTPAPEAKPVEPVAEAVKSEPLVNKSPENPMAMGMSTQTSHMAIHDAARDGNVEAVKQQLAAGTDVNSISEIGTTPLHHVTHFLDEIDIDTAKLLANSPGVINQDAGQFAQDWNRKPELEAQIEIIKLLIDKGADINASATMGSITETGRTPLYNAAESGRKEIVELLIEKGANINGNNSGLFGLSMRPLFSAASKDHLAIVELLIKNGANVNASIGFNNSSNTVLNWAIEHKKTKLVALLRKHGGKTGEELKAGGK
jgi:ankyrin repeat protein